MLILLTNDDGIYAEGLLILREFLKKRHDVVICAPENERTAVGHAITLHKPLRIKKIGEGIYATNGTPADCVILGVKVILKKRPDIVLSGINRGLNMGRDIHYSGTAAAAKEGAFLGIPSFAFSMDGGRDLLFHEGVRIVDKILELFLKENFPQGVFLNVNIPNLEEKKIKGFMVTRPSKIHYEEQIEERIDPRGNKYYWIGQNEKRFKPQRGTDFYAVSKGYISITPLSIEEDNRKLRAFVKKMLRRVL